MESKTIELEKKNVETKDEPVVICDICPRDFENCSEHCHAYYFLREKYYA